MPAQKVESRTKTQQNAGLGTGILYQKFQISYFLLQILVFRASLSNFYPKF